MSSSQLATISAFLEAGKAVYMEGVDVGTMHQEIPLLDLFGAAYVGQGNEGPNIRTLIGSENTFAEGVEIPYPNGTEPDFRVDKLQADEGTAFLADQNNVERAIYYDGGGAYRTIVTSSIFSSYKDVGGINTKPALMSLYLLLLTVDEIPSFVVNEDSILFESAYSGYNAEKTITIQNLGYSNLDLSNVQVNGAGFSYFGEAEISLGFGQSQDLTIYFSSAEIGEHSGTLTLSSNDPENQNVSIPLLANNMEAPVIGFDMEPISENVQINSNTILGTYSIQNNGASMLSATILPINEEDRNSGGPDDYGYFWKDSAEATGPDYEWNSIENMGTIVTFDSANEISEWIDLDFHFVFYGNVYTKLKLSSNGTIGFEDSFVADANNQAIPMAGGLDNYIAPFWDNLDPTQGGMIQYYHDTENHRFIIQFTEVSLSETIGDGTYTFQALLYENGMIEFIYNVMDGITTSGTVGIESAMGEQGLQVTYNSFFPFYHRRIRFTRGAHWLTASPSAIELAPNETVDISFFANTTSLDGGVHSANIKIESNDPENSLLLFPVTVNVQEVHNNEIANVNNLKVYGNFPNPFQANGRGGTTINFEIPQESKVTVSIFDMKGRKIKSLANKQFQSGKHSIFWNGQNENAEVVSSGVYFYKVETRQQSQTRKLLLMK